jgi:superfamily II DNA or RNA helicase
MMEITLRDYQQESIDKILAAYEQNRAGSELLVLPCSAGKTVIFSQIIHRLAQHYDTSAIVIAHRDELLDQAADKYRMVKPDAVIGKVGSGQYQYGGEVTVCGIMTISRPNHLKQLRALYGTGKNLLLIVDEAHHSMAQSYQTVLETLPDAFTLMVTATPDRLDGKPLLDGKKPLFEASIIDLATHNPPYLVDMRAIPIQTDVNLDDLHTQAGDFKVDELESAVDTIERNRLIVQKYQQYAAGRRAACFAVTVKHAQHLTDAFREAGIAAELVVGETSLEARKGIYKAFRDGSVRVLTTVNVLSEGWDEPLCDCIIMARPTQSRALFIQAIGRGLRLSPGKKDCIILDITDNCFKHRLEPLSLSKALGKKIKPEESLLEALEREKEEIGNKSSVPVTRKLKEQRNKDVELNLLVKLDWQQKDNGMFVLEIGQEKHRIAIVPLTDEDDEDMWDNPGYYSVWARLAPFYEPQEWLSSAPLDWCQQYAEKRARMLLSDANNIKLVDKNAAWRNYPASDKQIDMLIKFGVNFPRDENGWPAITKGEAADILDGVFEKLKKKREAREKVS